MDDNFVAWIWDDADGGLGRSASQIDIERGLEIVALVNLGSITKLIIRNLIICSLSRRGSWLLHLVLDA